VSTPVSLPFDTVLVANRGEIAVRVIRTLRRLGLRSVAVFSDADRAARHVAEADLAVRLGPAAASESYLHVGRVVDAARRTGAGALHPGYGFLAENPALAEACAAAGVTFVGPPPSAMAAMGDKIRAKQAVAAAGVAVVPGRTEAGMTDDDLAAAAAEVGYPVLLKPSAGGGGKGMRLVQDPPTCPTPSPGPGGRPWRPSATTRCSSSGSSPGPATSRSRSSRTSTATWSTSASASAACSDGTRRSSRRRRHRCSTTRPAPTSAPGRWRWRGRAATSTPARSSSWCPTRRPASRTSWR
jgi:hypothetical protein